MALFPLKYDASSNVPIGVQHRIPNVANLEFAGLPPTSEPVAENSINKYPVEVVRVLTATGRTFITDGVEAGDEVDISADVNGVSRDGTYTVRFVVSETVLIVEETVPAAASANATVAVRKGATAEVRSASGAVVPLVSGYGGGLIDFQNEEPLWIEGYHFMFGASCDWTLQIVNLNPTTRRIDSADPVTHASGTGTIVSSTTRFLLGAHQALQVTTTGPDAARLVRFWARNVRGSQG